MMASVWPTVQQESSNYNHITEYGLTDYSSGLDVVGSFEGKYLNEIDSTNPDTRSFVWSQLEANYYDKGVQNFWLDEDEGGTATLNSYPWADFSIGAGDQYSMLYPYYQQKMIADGQHNTSSAPTDAPTSVSLSRSSWAGSQRFPAAVWSGDTQ
jgi:alpha-D-xyloside xylohydrolase